MVDAQVHFTSYHLGQVHCHEASFGKERDDTGQELTHTLENRQIKLCIATTACITTIWIQTNGVLE
jgi:hypothetical protein